MDEDEELVSAAVAGQMSGVSERTVRRWVSGGHVPVVSAPGGNLVRLSDVQAYAADRERHRTAAGHAPVTSAGRPLSALVSGRPADMSVSVSATLEQVVAPLVAELTDARYRIEELARENGTLIERLRALEAARDASGGSGEASTPPEPAAAPTAPTAARPPMPSAPRLVPRPVPQTAPRPAPSVAARLARLARWWVRS